MYKFVIYQQVNTSLLSFVVDPRGLLFLSSILDEEHEETGDYSREGNGVVQNTSRDTEPFLSCTPISASNSETLDLNSNSS